MVVKTQICPCLKMILVGLGVSKALICVFADFVKNLILNNVEYLK